MIPALIFFDLDKTLAASKEAITPQMAELLKQLLHHTDVAVISGGAFAQLKQQVVDQLPVDTDLERLSILPTSGAALYSFKDGYWNPVYEERLTDAQATQIRTAIETAVGETGIIDSTTHSYGDRIEFRGSQVTFSALGQQAPIVEKAAWDEDGIKKHTLRDAIAPMLPDFDVKIGGATSVDITLHGVNKAYGVRQVGKIKSLLIEDMLYIGDALYAGGNDEVVKETGINTRQVKDPEDTMRVITELLHS
jgi:phosphomannomutase